MNRLLTIVDSKYQRLEYLESTGTQYIDTGIKNSETSLYDITFQVLDITKANTIVGCDTTFATSSDVVSSIINYGLLWYFGTGAYIQILNFASHSLLTNKSNIRKTYNSSNNTTTLTLNSGGQTFTGSSTKQNYSDLNYFLFAVNRNGTVSNQAKCARIYNAKFYNGSTLVRNFVPVLRKTDNELGMLDLVEGKFYPNAGTGKFTANLDTMYAIIQGSPTQSPYGVFSGFSASNYLKIKPQITTPDSIEFCTKITIGTIGTVQGIVANDYIANNGVALRANGQIVLTVNDGGIHQVASNISLETNKSYTIKILIQNGVKVKITILNSNNQVIDNVETDFSYSFNFANTNSIFYGGNSSWAVFTGSIDLNNSYIKIDDTKYKLQAVVGYTVVGSPTITDSVVSGLGGGNYLNLPSNTLTYNQLEYQIKIQTDGSSGYNVFITDEHNVYGQIYNTNRLYVGYWDSNNSLKPLKQETITANSWYKVRVLINKSQNLAKVWLNDVIIFESNAISFYDTTLTNIKVGSSFIGGSIDLKETYIKINNKLWFNGQQA